MVLNNCFELDISALGFHHFTVYWPSSQEANILSKVIFSNLIFCLVTADTDFDNLTKGQVSEMTKEIADKTENIINVNNLQVSLPL